MQTMVLNNKTVATIGQILICVRDFPVEHRPEAFYVRKGESVRLVGVVGDAIHCEVEPDRPSTIRLRLPISDVVLPKDYAPDFSKVADAMRAADIDDILVSLQMVLPEKLVGNSTIREGFANDLTDDMKVVTILKILE